MSSKVDLTSIYTSLAAAPSPLAFEVQAARRLGDSTCFKVIAATSAATEAEFAEAVVAATGGAGRLVPDTFVRGQGVASAVVAANARSRPMDASFTQVTASTASDAQGTIWRVESDAAGKRVVLESADDLDGIFADRVSRRTVHLNPVMGRAVASTACANGDLVTYADVAAREVAHGVAAQTGTGLTVVGLDGVPRSVDALAVVASVPRSRLPAEIASCVSPMEATSKLSPDRVDKMIAYLQKAYGPAAGPMLAKLRSMTAKAK